jgi:hypothetical protein
MQDDQREAVTRALRREHLLSQISVPEVMAALSVAEVPTETEQVQCPNPAHEDRTPSARYYISHGERGAIFCFKCAQSWDVVGLVQLLQRVSHDEACTWLEDAFGLSEGNDPSAVRTMLQRRVPHQTPAVEAAGVALYQYLQQAHARLDFDAFARAWAAYDVAAADLQQGRVDADGFLTQLATIRTFIDRYVPPTLGHRLA